MNYKVLQKNVNIVSWSKSYGLSIQVNASDYRNNDEFYNPPENTIDNDNSITNYWYSGDNKTDPQWIQYKFQFCTLVKNITVKCGDLRFKPCPLIFHGITNNNQYQTLVETEFDRESNKISKIKTFKISANKFFSCFRITNSELGPYINYYSFRIDSIEIFGDIILSNECSTLSSSMLETKKKITCDHSTNISLHYLILLILIKI